MAGTNAASMLAALERCIEHHPDRLFASDLSGRDFTFAGLYESALHWAGAFRSRGIAPGRTVITMLRNSVESLAVWLGLSSIGAIEVPINNELRGAVLRHIIDVAGAELIVVDARFVQRVLDVGPDVGLSTVVVIGDRPAAATPAGLTFVSAQELLADARPTAPVSAPRDHDIACVLFTSGTTGPSKGVRVPWANLHASALGSLPLADLGPDDVWYGPGSGSHVGAKSMPFLFAMLGGRVVLRERFSVSEFWTDIERHEATSTALVGSVAHYLYQQPAGERDADTPLRNVLMVPVIPEFHAFNERFGTRICTVFNMTEISVPIVSDGWNIGDWRSAGRCRVGDPGYEVRLVDEHDREVAVGDVGEMVVRTSVPWAVNAGYLGMPAATAEAWRNGWFHTGDLFRRDQHGQYFFVDRAKDAVRVGGENVSSAEVESEVNRHPAVSESAAVAVPSEFSEDDIKVYVVLRPKAEATPEDLIAFLIPRMPRFMLPRYLEFVSELPKNWRLRVQKNVLRERGIGKAWDRVAASVEIPRS